ncbi:MAG: hypothetical protein AABX39_02800 [Nanoarchaeota archaeon]
MATPLDLGLLKQFDVLFPFLFVLVIVFAVLYRTTTFKEKPGLAAIIAFLLAIMTVVSPVAPIATKSINLMAPGFIILFIFITFLMLVYQTFGVKEESITKLITDSEYSNTIVMILLVISVIIAAGAISKSYSEEKQFTKLTEIGTITPSAEESEFWQTVFHPKILGTVLFLLIALFTVQKMALKGNE